MAGLLSDLGGGGLSGSSSANSSAGSTVSNVTTSGGLNIWEVILAIAILIIVGLFITLHKK